MSKLVTINWDEVDKLSPIDAELVQQGVHDLMRKLLSLGAQDILAMTSFGQATVDLECEEIGLPSGSTVHRAIVIIYKEA